MIQMLTSIATVTNGDAQWSVTFLVFRWKSHSEHTAYKHHCFFINIKYSSVIRMCCFQHTGMTNNLHLNDNLKYICILILHVYDLPYVNFFIYLIVKYLYP